MSPLRTAALPSQTDDEIAEYQQQNDQMDEDDDEDDSMERDIPQPIPMRTETHLMEPTPGPFKLDPYFLQEIKSSTSPLNLKKFDLSFLKSEVRIPSADEEREGP